MYIRKYTHFLRTCLYKNNVVSLQHFESVARLPVRRLAEIAKWFSNISFFVKVWRDIISSHCFLWVFEKNSVASLQPWASVAGTGCPLPALAAGRSPSDCQTFLCVKVWRDSAYMQRRLLLPLQYTLLHSCCIMSVLGNFCPEVDEFFTWSFFYKKMECICLEIDLTKTLQCSMLIMSPWWLW